MVIFMHGHPRRWILALAWALAPGLLAQERLEVFVPPPADPGLVERRFQDDPATAGRAVRIHQRADTAALAVAEAGTLALVPAFFAASLPTWQTVLAGQDAQGPTLRYHVLRLARAKDQPLRSLGMVAEADQRTSLQVINRIAPPLATVRLRRFATLESLVNALAMEVIDAALVSPAQEAWIGQRYRTPTLPVSESAPIPHPSVIAAASVPTMSAAPLQGLQSSSLEALGLTALRPVGGP